MKLVVGLGNPGKEYERTRHNAGFLVLDALAAEAGARWTEDKKRSSCTAKTRIEGTDVLLAKPQTYMNASGEAVRLLSSYYKVPIEDILIVQDELDLEPGEMAFLGKGGTAGHNGITSVHEALGRTDVLRLRIGVGRPNDRTPAERWVLGPLDPETSKTVGDAPKAVADWIRHGPAKAMNVWNRKREG